MRAQELRDKETKRPSTRSQAPRVAPRNCASPISVFAEELLKEMEMPLDKLRRRKASRSRSPTPAGFLPDAPETAPETAPKSAPETAPESAPETATESVAESAPECAPECVTESVTGSAPESAPEKGTAGEVVDKMSGCVWHPPVQTTVATFCAVSAARCAADASSRLSFARTAARCALPRASSCRRGRTVCMPGALVECAR